jgi:hypothetical protein
MFLTAVPWYADSDWWWEEGYSPFVESSFVQSNWVLKQTVEVLQAIYVPETLRQLLGGGLIIAGVLIVMPGPAYLAVGAIGASIAGPVGAVVAIGLYILLGLALIAAGYLLI